MSSKGKKPAGKTQRSAIADVVAREYTIHMHKRVRRTPYDLEDSERDIEEEDTDMIWLFQDARCHLQEASSPRR